MIRTIRWFGIVIGILFAVLIVIPATIIGIMALFYDWNDARPLIGELASKALGRDVAIEGNLDVDPGSVTRIDLHGLSVANAPWGQASDLLKIGDLSVSIEVWPLLQGNIVIPSLSLAHVAGNLERNIDGQANWQFGSPATEEEREKPGTPGQLPLIESLQVQDARISVDDRRLGRSAALVVDQLQAGENRAQQQMTAKGRGSYSGRPASLDATMGSLNLLQEGGEPYPLDVVLQAGDLHTHIKGTIADPRALEGVNLNLKVSGDDLSNLFPLTGIPVPPSPPYQLSGRLGRQGETWRFTDFAGKLGDSDLEGTASADLGRERPRIEADVRSNLLDLKDLAPFIGAKPGGEQPQSETSEDVQTDRVLPNKHIELKQLRAVDAKIHFHGNRIVTPKVPIDRMDVQMSLEDGTLRVQPATFDIGKGNVRVFLSLYGSQKPVHSDIDAVISNVDLRRLLRDAGQSAAESAGLFNGRAKLAATGTSVAEIAGSSTGEVMVVLSDGRFSALLTELIGLDIAESLGFLVEGDKTIPIRCAVADFRADQGVFNSRALVFDTSDTKVMGTGDINMRDETLSMRLRAMPKDFSPLTVRTPISIGGTLAQPDAFPDPANIGTGGVLEKALNAVLTVVTGLLPPVDLGSGEDAPCGALIRQARHAVGEDAPASTQ